MEAANRPPSIPPNFISLHKLQQLRIKEQKEHKLKQKEEEEELRIKEQELALRKVKGQNIFGDEEIKPPGFQHRGGRNKKRPLFVKKEGGTSSKSSEQQSVDLEELRRMKKKEKKMKMKLKRKLKMEMEKALAATNDENVDGKEKNNEGVLVNPMVGIVVDEKKVVVKQSRKWRLLKGKSVSSAEIVGKKTSLMVENVVDDEKKKVKCAGEKERNEVVIGESSRNGGNWQWKTKPNNRNVKEVFHNPTVEIVEKIGALTVGGDVVKTIGQYCDKSTVETKVSDGEVKMKGEECNISKAEMNGCDLGFRRRFGYGGRERRDEIVMWVKKEENEEEESGGGGGGGLFFSSAGGRRFSGGRGRGKY